MQRPEIRNVVSPRRRTAANGAAGSREDVSVVLTAIAEGFLGVPYLAHPLDQTGPEHLVVNLDAFDCVTFVETAVALARLPADGRADREGLARAVEEIRYRGGRLDGYASRLHYFSDWLRDNKARGILEDMTARLGGTPWEKRLNFMTAHRDRYPPLADPECYRRVRAVEEALTAMPKVHLPRGRFRSQEARIHDGDILAVTALQDGIDVLHVGFAVRRRGRIHLLHASEAAGRVVVSPETVYRYLHRRRARTGLLVARLRAGAGLPTSGRPAGPAGTPT
ncbi:MAG: DUF1460 domain-containing protein [Syntrophales bacterium]|jgi:hypothetical protein|nr:DUF1460 domain-containing protein [Syntrophales bacterium]HOG08015.1 DUF1460 domain-containing protein [Syntrophales bacterium]HOS76930.1 DUF1460 domain-containing protein [Syntrophales bacterium]HPB70536.1 DUF1460 domain-containing protein [Syntrophales bacterium]HQN26237.1 DUF1460 domain-containing protein [Syntrophales bacterium]